MIRNWTNLEADIQSLIEFFSKAFFPKLNVLRGKKNILTEVDGCVSPLISHEQHVFILKALEALKKKSGLRTQRSFLEEPALFPSAFEM